MMVERNIKITQHPLWDILNEIELPIVTNLRQIFMINRTKQFWKSFAVFGSASFVSSLPTIFFALGLISDSKKIAAALIFYALISSIGKDLFRRRRPSTYEMIQTSTSIHSFPSRHTIGITIFACFTPYKYQLVCFMALDRILMGKHFVTDCIAGYLIGELCVYLGTCIQNMNLLLVILSIDMMIWNGAAKIMAEIIPVLMSPSFSQASIPFALSMIALKFITVFIIKKFIPKSEKAKKLIAEFFTSSLMIFIILQVNSYMMPFSENPSIPDVPIYKSSEPTDSNIISGQSATITEDFISNFAEMNSISSL